MKDETQTRYCNRSLPSKPLPPGRVLVHNHVVPDLELGLSGFRAWTQLKTRNLVRCHCSFGTIKNAEVNKHYRINRGDTPEERRANKVAHAACEEVMSRGIRFRNDAPDDLIFERWEALRKRAAAASAKSDEQMTGFLVHADYKPKMDKRREDRINVALDRCNAWRPGGRVIIDGQEATILRGVNWKPGRGTLMPANDEYNVFGSENERVEQ